MDAESQYVAELKSLIAEMADTMEQASILHLVSGSLPERFSHKVRELIQRAREETNAQGR